MNTGIVRGIRGIRPGLAALSMLVLLASSASAAKLSGAVTIRNGASQGPIRVYVIRLGFPGILAGTDIISRPGGWEVTGLLDGTYFVLGFADQNTNSFPDRGEPLGFFGSGTPQRVVISGNRNVANVNITLEPVSIAAELRGRVIYSGPRQGRIWIFPHLGEEFEPLNVRGTPWTITEPGNYQSFVFLDDTYYVTAYVDVNGNLVHDQGEPIGTSRAVDVVVTPTATYSNVDILLTNSATTAVEGRTWSQVKSFYQD